MGRLPFVLSPSGTLEPFPRSPVAEEGKGNVARFYSVARL